MAPDEYSFEDSKLYVSGRYEAQTKPSTTAKEHRGTNIGLREAKHRLAFTLAEILITLSIIGVVAALTIPSLIVKNQEKERIVQLKKAYNVLSNAISLAITDYGSPDNWGWQCTANPDTGAPSDETSGPTSTKVLNILSNYLNLMKNCGTNKGCMPYKTKSLNGNVYPPADNNLFSAKAILNDGMIINIASYSNSCDTNWAGTSNSLKNMCGTIYVDINGAKKPNVSGLDVFAFYITKQGLVPMGTPEETNNTLTLTCKNKMATGNGGCTAWVLTKENMDYLRRDISWDE